MKKAHAIVALASCLAAAAHAEGTPQMPEGLLACSKVEDAAERVRCYDAQVAAMKKRTGSPESSGVHTAPAAPAAPTASSPASEPSGYGTAAPRAAPPPAPAPAPPPVPAAQSGSAQPPTARQDSAERFGEEELPQAQQPKSIRKHETLESSITRVSQLGYDSYLFSLANGQVWRVDGSHLTFFHVGYPVRIERHSLGGYHMSSPTLGAKNWVRVTRVR